MKSMKKWLSVFFCILLGVSCTPVFADSEVADSFAEVSVISAAEYTTQEVIAAEAVSQNPAAVTVSGASSPASGSGQLTGTTVDAVGTEPEILAVVRTLSEDSAVKGADSKYAAAGRSDADVLSAADSDADSEAGTRPVADEGQEGNESAGTVKETDAAVVKDAAEAVVKDAAAAAAAMPETLKEEESAAKDTSSRKAGLMLDGEGVMDVLVTGTLKGGDTPILISETVTPENVSVTVWAIESPVQTEDGAHVVFEETADPSAAPAVTADTVQLEKAIHYIILVEPSQKNIISLAGTSKKRDFDVASQEEIVTMKIHVPSGYLLTGAYNGKNKRVPLQKNAAGEYYVQVPMGGGVYLSAELRKMDNNSADTDVSFGFVVTQCCTEPAEDDANLIFDPNGGLLRGSGKPLRVKAAPGTEYKLPEAPSRPGYRFIRWQSSLKDITACHPGDTFIVPDQKITFTAVWKPESKGSVTPYGAETDRDDAEGNSGDDDGPDVTETVWTTTDNPEEMNIRSLTVKGNPAVGIVMHASRDVDVDQAITIQGGSIGATGIIAGAAGRKITAEVETGKGMSVTATDGGSSYGIQSYVPEDSQVSLGFEGDITAQSEGTSAGVQIMAEKGGTAAIDVQGSISVK